MTRQPALVLLLAAVMLGVGLYLVLTLSQMPIASVRIVGELRQVNRVALQEVVADQLTRGFFGVNVDRVRASVIELPWVKEVSVRRVWPGSLHLVLTEREAVARWEAGGLIASDGTLFFPSPDTYPSRLPLLAGPRGTHRRMLRRYRELEQMLAPLGRDIQRLSLTRRRAWRVKFDNDMTLVLGASEDNVALAQFVPAFRTALGARLDEVDQVDLRYASGFAVRWKVLANTKAIQDAEG